MDTSSAKHTCSRVRRTKPKRTVRKTFEEGNAGVFIAAGILFTALFIASVLAVVNWVTS
jgi:hypothetical protein